MNSQETVGSDPGLQIANFINFNDKDDIGYLFDRTDEGSNEEWTNYFEDGKEIKIHMNPTTNDFGQIDLTNISYDNYHEVVQFSNYVIEEILFIKNNITVKTISCYIPIGPNYVENFMMNGKNYDLEMCIGENQDELTIHLQLSFFNMNRFD
tara:strand:+ start:139 stop:594 length:456 start_codon:yes stop_codon:yes gene_type:complete